MKHMDFRHIWPRGTAKPLPTPELNLKVGQRRYRKRKEHPNKGIRQKEHRKEQTIGASKYSVLLRHKDYRHIWPRGTAHQSEPQVCISMRIKKTGKK